jgi:hypothetical protein
MKGENNNPIDPVNPVLSILNKIQNYTYKRTFVSEVLPLLQVTKTIHSWASPQYT